MGRLLDLLRDVFETLRIPIGAGLVLVAIGWIATPWQPAVPDVHLEPVWIVSGVVAVLAAGAGRVVGPSIIAHLLREDPDHVLVSLGLAENEEFRTYELNDQAMAELEVVGGDLYQYPNAVYDVRECVRYDPETNTAFATWRGALSDREQARTQAKIEENRQHLEEAAMKGVHVDVNKGPIIRRALREYVHLLNRTVEDLTLPDASVLEELMDDVTDGIESATDRDRRGESDQEAESGDESGSGVTVVAESMEDADAALDALANGEGAATDGGDDV